MKNLFESYDDVFPPYDDEAYWEYLMDEANCYAGEGSIQGSLLHNMQVMDYDEVTGRKND